MAKQRRSLSGKVVAITGGARGIGRTTAQALVRKGCRVALGDLDLEPAEQTAAELGGGTIALQLNVTDRDSFTAFLDEAERQLGPVDVLINNAGIMPVTPFEQESDDSIRRQLDINVYGVMVGTQLAVRRMKATGARPHRQHRLLGRQSGRARDRHLRGDQARGRRAHRGGASRVPRQRRRVLLRHADHGQHAADRRPRRQARRQAGRARGRREGDRRRARAGQGRRLRAPRTEGLGRARHAAAASGARGARALHGRHRGDDRGRPGGPPAYEERISHNDAGVEARGRARAQPTPRAAALTATRPEAMGRIYDATWGAAVRGDLRPRPEGDRRRRAAGDAARDAAIRDGRTIDLGAGTGANLELFPEAVTELVLAEPDPHMLKQLRSKVGEGARASRSSAPAERLPFEDSSFDTAVFTLVLCTVPGSGRGAGRGRPRPQAGRQAALRRARARRRIPTWRAGRTASKNPGASSATAATATATRSRRSKPRR